METFFLIILIPILIAWLGRLFFKATITWEEMAIQLVVASVITAAVWFAGSYQQLADVEVWNGQIVSKHRDHGSYVRTYQCNCRTVKVGDSTTTQCSTCYETRYTVDWYLKTTIGTINIDRLDRTSRSVYNSPDPAPYTKAYVGEPVARERSYTNYIKAAPDSLFNMSKVRMLEHFDPLIPQYPRVHSFYKINRIIPLGIPLSNVDEWNKHLSYHLRTIGPKKQANIIIILVDTPDQTYRYALEHRWLGGKKNDIIVILGTPNFPEIAWADTITLGQNMGNSLMTVEMRDSLMALGVADNYEIVIDTIANVVNTRFDRKPMADFEYLKDSIEPPLWLIILAIIVAVAASSGMMYYFHTHTHIKIVWSNVFPQIRS